MISGCVQTPPAADAPAIVEQAAPSEPAVAQATELSERAEQLSYITNGTWSFTVAPGKYSILPALSVSVDVSLPPEEGVEAAAGMAKAHMGVFLPDVPAGTKVPVIVDVGPYYSASSGNVPLQLEGDTVATEPAARLGKFLITNFVPHGYAVAQVSVFGTGDSTNCMDLMGKSEQAGIDAAITWLGTQGWSNGKVALIGRSYDGTTPWEAAASGNPHLATIVPISGLIGQHELMWRNGSSESRGGSGLLYAIYAADTIDGDAGDATAVLCKDYLTGGPMSWAAGVTGDNVAPEVNDYWVERYFLDRALKNYKGSVYLTHGLQDWNVDPHMAFPTHQKLVDAGLDVKGLYGQWAHMYPDRINEHVGLPEGYGKEAFPKSVRFDWAQDLLEWFDYYLMGLGPKPALVAEVQDSGGLWRVEETYPPKDAKWIDLALSTGEKLHGDRPDVITLAGAAGQVEGAPVDTDISLRYKFAPLSLDKDTRIAGLAQLSLTLTPSGPGGQVFAQLRDSETGLRVGHAIMDLRYAAGGKEMVPVVPGMPLTAKMEFEAFDVVLPAGHGLVLILAPFGEDYLPSDVSDPLVVDSAASILKLPTVDRSPEVFFTPPEPTVEAGAAVAQP